MVHTIKGNTSQSRRNRVELFFFLFFISSFHGRGHDRAFKWPDFYDHREFDGKIFRNKKKAKNLRLETSNFRVEHACHYTDHWRSMRVKKPGQFNYNTNSLF